MQVIRPLIKMTLKSAALTVAVAAVGGIATLVRSRSTAPATPVTYDQWPDVPENPVADQT